CRSAGPGRRAGRSARPGHRLIQLQNHLRGRGTMHHQSRTTAARGTIAVALLALAIQTALAQDAAPAPADAGQDEAVQLDQIVVVGSHIRGAPTTEALPVVVMDADQIDAAGAASGDELLRDIPQMGDVLFDSSNNPQTSNAARGDVNSVNLRS